MLSELGLTERIAYLIPNLILSIETSTILNEHSQAEKYLEKSFDVLQYLLQSSSTEIKTSFCSEHILKETIMKIVHKTINEPSPITL